MNFNFELILFYAVIVCGLIALFDCIFLAKKRNAIQAGIKKEDRKLPMLIDYARSFFPILLAVFLIRSFLYEPFRIPTGSLIPTLNVGDFILVNKFDYGMRLPVVSKKIYPIGEPNRGDIFVFRWPPNPSVVFIKRVIGLPSDRISYVNKVLFINGQEAVQTVVEPMNTEGVVKKEENLLGVKHLIQVIEGRSTEDFHDIIVPPGMYFAMGDNRDDSADSRFFGFVPEQNIVGKARVVWMSWDSGSYRVRWSRLGQVIH